MTGVLSRDDFGDVLRDWRSRRNFSQLALAGSAGVSQRHISFLETGRSKPSREMVMHLGVVLDMSLRDRNAMLVSAGFAPVFAERSIDDPDMADIRRALETMLRAHEPFPAYVIDRHWNLVMANTAAINMIATLPAAAQVHAANTARLMLHPDGMREAIVNWPEVAAAMLLRLEREADESPADRELGALADEVRAYAGLPGDRELARVPNTHDLIVPLTLRLGERTLSFFTTIATLPFAADITLQELRLETLLPADQESETALHEFRDGSTDGGSARDGATSSSL